MYVEKTEIERERERKRKARESGESERSVYKGIEIKECGIIFARLPRLSNCAADPFRVCCRRRRR